MEKDLNEKLTKIGFTEELIKKLEEQGGNTENDMQFFTAEELQKKIGLGIVPSKKFVMEFGPKVPEPKADAKIDDDAEIKGEHPNPGQINDYASQMGIDPSMLSMLFFAKMGEGSGLDMDMSSMIPVASIVPGYNPKKRDMAYMIMGQIENRIGAPIIVIDSDGAINHQLTIEYIMELDEGFEPSEDNIYHDKEGNPFEIIKVGVDAQSIYDADPLNSSKALQKNGMGTGRITWTGVGIEIKQLVYFAVNQTHEINPKDDADLRWLRDRIKKGVNKMDLRGQCPNAIAAFNEAARTGTLPTLRVQLTRQPRRKETMPRRRTSTVRKEVETSGLNEFRD